MDDETFESHNLFTTMERTFSTAPEFNNINNQVDLNYYRIFLISSFPEQIRQQLMNKFFPWIFMTRSKQIHHGSGIVMTMPNRKEEKAI